jgi:four helix bundle protein
MEKDKFNNAKKISSYRDLAVWQKAMDFAEQVYLTTENFPKSEIYGLTNQVRRASISVASNIAEGSARKSTLDFMRFIKIALGSLVEAETQIILASKLKYINEDAEQNLLSMSDVIGKMLQGLYNSLKNKP